MTKLVKGFFKRLRRQMMFYKRHGWTKQKLRQNMQRIQDGKSIKSNLKEMRTMSRLLRHEQYGTTKIASEPLKLDLTTDVNGTRIVLSHTKQKHHSKINDRGRS
ncbi:MAG: hypothetical protein IKV03_04980 [Alphaproteobacteria bacterium]|nr:hypothetical protein [Alphaproteobacteria bacterium]